MNKHSVAVGIPTFARPLGLSRLLESLEHMERPVGKNVVILIADNENGNAEVKRIVDQFRDSSSGFRNIQLIPVSRRGISFARNALLEAAFENDANDFLIMVDDDETVASSWLTNMLRVQSIYDVDCVGGKKTPIFAKQPDAWMVNSQIYTYAPRTGEGRCKRLVSTDNLLLSRDAYTQHGCPKFDVDFALSGGGDTEYLQRLSKSGAQFAFSDKAQTYEHVTSARMEWSWAKARAYRIGIGLARIHKLHSTSFGEKVYTWLRLAVIMMASGFLICISVFVTNYRKKNQLFFIQQLGKLAGFSGKRVFPYASKESQ